MQIGDTVQYIVSYGDSAATHVPIGTCITATIVGVHTQSVDVKWHDPKITEVETEYGLPEELLTLLFSERRRP